MSASIFRADRTGEPVPCDWCREPIAMAELHVLYDGHTTYGYTHQRCAQAWYRAVEVGERLLGRAGLS